MQPTIKDVAERAGVSIATVSRMLNGSDKITKETSKAVQKAIDDLAYKPIRKKKTKKGEDRQIGLIMPDTSLYTLGSTIKDITAILSEENYDLRIINLNRKREITEEIIRSILGKKLTGAIFYGCVMSQEMVEILKEARLPSVMFQGSSPYMVSVSVNNYNGMQNAIRYILSRGYKKVAFVGWEEMDFNMQARMNAFNNVMTESGLNTDLVRLDSLNRRGGYNTTRELWENDHPEAILYAADILAYGGYRYFRENGISIPEDVGIMGFDDAYLSEVIGLTTMYQLLDAKLRIVMEHLLKMLHDKEEIQPEEVLVTPRLVVRNSLK